LSGKAQPVSEGLYGLPFLYPGTGIEMKRGGRNVVVNAENVAEYVRLVEDFTCGSYMTSKMLYFLNSFETNIQRETLSLLSPDEIV
jgi:hypothetical protein